MPTGVFVRSDAHRAKSRATALRLGLKPPSPKGTVWTADRKEKLAAKKRGIPRPQAVRDAMVPTQFKPGALPYNKGKHVPPEQSPGWQGGISRKFKLLTATRPKPNACEICGAFASDFKKGLCFDHDHKTDQFRGWLCTRCNVAIGMVKENTEILMAIVEYIRHGGPVQ